jgi:inosine triphosphate pyrophosphatase
VAFVTGNKGKLEEVRSLLSDGVPGLVLTSLDADLPELQGDPAEIVREKCLAALGRAGGSPVIVEDTSLCFNALGGMPGPYVKWFLEAVGHAGLNKMLDGFEDRSAYARTVVGYCAGGADREVHVFEGRTDGCIVQPRGGGGGRGVWMGPRVRVRGGGRQDHRRHVRRDGQGGQEQGFAQGQGVWEAQGVLGWHA